MTRKDFENLVFEIYGVKADYPFEDDFVSAVFRHGSGKWFAIAMNVSERKIGHDGDRQISIVNLKCAPEVIESLANVEYGIYPAYHMNKTHWLTVALEECDNGTIEWLLGISHNLTKCKKKTRSTRR